jgi:hypothetical protein
MFPHIVTKTGRGPNHKTGEAASREDISADDRNTHTHTHTPHPDTFTFRTTHPAFSLKGSWAYLLFDTCKLVEQRKTDIKQEHSETMATTTLDQ